ncbi:hypothetical protein Glove_216g168 [Diversispora epigaea]|uniref:Uncharacterized protein n=1 Tax=Diversispora epigaea TaxID=1348612 RepID=A0A397IK03_9GLOM|nr:hypothetical protein Glove_216g168 [Diversispora epigaea]
MYKNVKISSLIYLIFHFKGEDCKIAKNWEKVHNLDKTNGVPSININNSIGTINGTIKGGMNNSKISTFKKRDKKKDLDNEIDKFWQSPNERQPNQFTKKLRKSKIADKRKYTQSDEDNDFDDDDDNEKNREMSESNVSEFKDSYKGMKKEKKWYLKSSKCVEDELYAFGIQCRFEHNISSSLAHSFIIDPDDETYIKNNIFTSEELKEIRDTSKKLSKNWEGKNFDRIKHFNFDWAWHNVHIWAFIDRCFNELKGVDIARGPGSST